ncbi:hypothetical protein I350_00682 [Cryptococcus amylolentus CBS 6273]|uniref:Transcription factor domain-containing protein n=1 Tax=Cryptococcus amylolentus CBS 6273 TaxID=1296118 RepID=A0A1E3KFN4_9TREE|nr:hypothetical protein I350_00682 [Cryptococcus amylolentus CBS 6273]
MAELIEENKSLLRKVNAQQKIINAFSGDQGFSHADELRDPPFFPESAAYEPEQEVAEQDAERGEQPDYLFTIREVYGTAPESPKLIFTQDTEAARHSLLAIVPTQYSHYLVRHHCKVLHWIHAVFHIPSFLSTHDGWIASIQRGQLTDQSYDWLSLYFAIISASLYFLDETEAMGLGLTKEALPRLWFDISINCLHLGQYMVRSTIPILQTICVLPLVAHSFGMSAYLFSLLELAFNMAKDLNLHLLADESIYAASLGNVDSEMGKRIWTCLDVAHCMHPSISQPYALLYPTSRTSPPANVDDAHFSDTVPAISRPLYQTTGVTHLISMGQFASLYRGFNTEYNKETTTYARFLVAQKYGQKAGTILDSMPEHQPRPLEQYYPIVATGEAFNYRPWSRFLFSSLIPQCRIHFFRWFLRPAYGDDRFREARKICLQASREIIELRCKPIPPLYQKNWHVSVNTIMAATVIATELLHGGHEEPVKVGFRTEVNTAIEILRQSNTTNTIIPRGIELLQRMLAEEAAAAAWTQEGFWKSLAEISADEDLLALLLGNGSS